MLKNDLLSTIPTEVVTHEVITKLQPIDINRSMQVSRSWNSLFGHANQLAWKKLIERDFAIPLKTLNLFEQLAKIALDRVEVSWYVSNKTILTRPLSNSFKNIYQKLRRFRDVYPKLVDQLSCSIYSDFFYYFHHNHLQLLALCTGYIDIIASFFTPRERHYFRHISLCLDCPHVYSYFEGIIHNLGLLVDVRLFNLIHHFITRGHRHSIDLSCDLPTINSILSKGDKHSIQLVKLNIEGKALPDHPVTKELLIALAEIDLNRAKQLIKKYDLANPITTEMLILAYEIGETGFIKKHIQYHNPHPTYSDESRARSDYSGITWEILDEIISKNLFRLFEFLFNEDNKIYISCLLSENDRIKLLRSAAINSNILFLNYLLANRKRLNLIPDASILLSAIRAERYTNFYNLLNPEFGIQPTIEHLEAAIGVNNEVIIKLLAVRFKLIPTQAMLDMACARRRVLFCSNIWNLPATHIIRYLLELNPELSVPKSCFFEEDCYEETLLNFVSSFTFTQDEVETLVKNKKFMLARHIIQNQSVSLTNEMIRLALQYQEIDFAQFLLQPKYGFIKNNNVFSDSVHCRLFRTARFLLNPQFKQKPTLDDFVELVNHNEITLADKLIKDKYFSVHSCLCYLFNNWKLSEELNNVSFATFEFIFTHAIQNKCFPDKEVVLSILRIKRDLLIVNLLLNPILHIQFNAKDISRFEHFWMYDYYGFQKDLLCADVKIEDCLVDLKNSDLINASESFALSHNYSPIQCLRVAYFAVSNPQFYQLNVIHLSSLIDFIMDVGSKYFYTIPECLEVKQYLVVATEQLRENRMSSLADRLEAITFYDTLKQVRHSTPTLSLRI